MPYIGNTAADRFVASKAASVFSGDGSTTAFTLDHSVGSDEDILVSVDGVIQEPSVAYSVSGTTLTFTAAPSSNAGNNIFVYYLFRTVGTVSHPSSNALEATSGTFSGDLTVDTNTLKVDSTNNRVGIGTTNPSSLLDVQGNLRATHSSGDRISINHDGTNGSLTNVGGDFLLYAAGSQAMILHTDSTERMRIDSSGKLLVGKTSDDNSAGISLRNTGEGYFVRDGANTLALNRLSSDGDLISFFKDTSSVGSIGINSDRFEFVNKVDADKAGLSFHNRIAPMKNGSTSDNQIDLGEPSIRFDDIYATNGTIQTSDRNEKQDIEELSDAEQRVAVVAKGLMRKFRWRDAVAEKGDNARTHFGIIAQDLQDAFTAEGLDAGDYAMFTSNTWWEKEISVDAVEADEENGIEAQDAYTYIDTKEEATEGYTEKTRLGVRYNQLLAFIISAL
jgi:hypothetical protein